MTANPMENPMPQYEVRINETVNAPREKVFAFFADHEKFATLFGAGCRVVKKSSDPDQPNGLGSVRRMGPGPLSFDETIVGFEAPKSIQYSISRGSPLKNHIGIIDFSSRGPNTRVEYVIRFDSRIPFAGKLIAKALTAAWKRSAPKILARLGD
jgi:uncharacterized protein YndB with AHSA1/START domain